MFLLSYWYNYALIYFVSAIFIIAAKLVPVGYGIKKLQISAVIEDEKVSFCIFSKVNQIFLESHLKWNPTPLVKGNH